MTRITCLSDLHGYQPELPGGDILIIAGDLTAKDTVDEHYSFLNWTLKFDYTHIVCIAGNHDNALIDLPHLEGNIKRKNFYLIDSGCEIMGLKFWGMPWTTRFYGQNPKAMAFTVYNEADMKDKCAQIPIDTDVLITHSPPAGILDKCPHGRLGSEALYKRVMEVEPALHVFGHIHGSGGQQTRLNETLLVNAAYCDEAYQPRKEIITLDL